MNNFEENKKVSLYDRRTKPERIDKDEEIYDKNNVIFIGHKQPNSYVLYIISQFNLNKTDEIVLKARGDLIQRAITVACILKTNHIPDLSFETTIDSILRNGENGDVFVPCISIRVLRPNNS